MDDNSNQAPQTPTSPEQPTQQQPLPSYPNPTNNTGELPSAFALFSPSVQALKRNLWTYLGTYGILVVLGVLLGFTSAPASPANSSTEVRTTIAFNGISILLGLVLAVLALVLSPAATYIQIQSAKGNSISIGGALKYGLRFVLRYIGLALLVGCLIVGGLILFIVPGLIMIRRYFLSAYYLVDQDLGILEAMKRSANATKPYGGAIWGVIGVTILCGLPSLIPVVGRVIAAVVGLPYSFAPAIRYIQINDGVKYDAPSAPVATNNPVTS